MSAGAYFKHVDTSKSSLDREIRTSMSHWKSRFVISGFSHYRNCREYLVENNCKAKFRAVWQNSIFLSRQATSLRPHGCINWDSIISEIKNNLIPTLASNSKFSQQFLEMARFVCSTVMFNLVPCVYTK